LDVIALLVFAILVAVAVVISGPGFAPGLTVLGNPTDIRRGRLSRKNGRNSLVGLRYPRTVAASP
jgi:hypothetical protein